MSQEQAKSLFPSLSQLLMLPESNWEQDLSYEQYFAMVLAYNDKIVCKKREHKKRFGKTVYELSDQEKTALELAFKSGVTGNFSEEDVIKKFETFCSKDVNVVLREESSRKDKLQELHNLAVAKISERSDVVASFGYYSRVTQIAEQINGIISKENYKRDCEFLDNLRELLQDPDKLKIMAKNNNSNVEVSQMREGIESASQMTLESIYVHIARSVGCVAGFDAYKQLNEEVQAG